MTTRALTLLVILTLAATTCASGAARDVESLKGVTAFKVELEYKPSPGTASYLELTAGHLQATVEARLRDGGLPVLELGDPYLRIHILSGGNDHGLIMYGVELDFMQEGPSADDTAFLETWQLHSAGIVDNREMQGQVQKDLEDGLDEFIHDWFSVNPTASE
ncbi:MAG: hypothetical protein VYE73_04980 [Acidobacteriota bacterium]|nr:hypothetical protein [Acidobacteriota bacterium]